MIDLQTFLDSLDFNNLQGMANNELEFEDDDDGNEASLPTKRSPNQGSQANNIDKNSMTGEGGSQKINVKIKEKKQKVL